ncbi:MAG TPA: hypothetical protein PLF22_01250 [Pseudomonadales bacterium]|nr:hypothetical protein [Pseudomonadales bacterium]
MLKSAARKIRLIRAGSHDLYRMICAFIKLEMAWILPTLAILALVAALLSLVAGAGPLAPFVYPLF